MKKTLTIRYTGTEYVRTIASTANNLDRAVSGASLSFLTPGQIRELVLLAKRAYEKTVAALAVSGIAMFFDDWRHFHCRTAVGRDGLTQARQEDFLPLRAHFLTMLGQTAMAGRDLLRAGTDPRRVALYKLTHECTKAEDVIQDSQSYVSAIARARYHGTAIADLAARQIWGLVFDLRRNAQRRRATKGSGVPF